MAEPELVDAYLEGKIGTWAFVRRLLKAGLSVGTAVAFTALLPAAAQSGDLSPLERLTENAAKKNPDEAEVLERLMERVARGLDRIGDGGGQAQLGHSLVGLGLNVANQGLGSADLSFNGEVRKVPVSLFGNLSCDAPNLSVSATDLTEQNCTLDLGGEIGEVPVSLVGSIQVNVNGQRGPQGVNLSISGNVGEIPVNFNGGPPDLGGNNPGNNPGNLNDPG